MEWEGVWAEETIEMFEHVYGPVPSRRLGRSLGVSPIPSKTCNYSCVYCQLGRTDQMLNERRDFYSPDEILDEIMEAVKEKKEEIDYITFVGEGEPTLYKSLGYLIEETKRKTSIPVAVITNGSLLSRNDVRDDLENVDVLLPSLDASEEETFLKINRPHRGIKFEEMLNGLIEFSRKRKGQLWAEVMLVKGVNDSEKELSGISKILRKVKVDRVYVNVPIRPPAEKWVEVPSDEALVRAHEILGSYVVNEYEMGDFQVGSGDPYEEIIHICERHPMRSDQIENLSKRFSIPFEEMLSQLERDPRVKEIEYRGKKFFLAKEQRRAR